MEHFEEEQEATETELKSVCLTLISAAALLLTTFVVIALL
jgi:hypothetical protein